MSAIVITFILGMLSHFGTPTTMEPTHYDLNGDGEISTQDLIIALSLDGDDL